MRIRITDLRRIKAGDLFADPRNSRQHSEAQRRAYRALTEEVGFVGALLAREDERANLILLDGHMRADEADPNQILPVLVTDLSEEEAATVLLTFDPLGAMAEQNRARADELLGQARTSAEDLLSRLRGATTETSGPDGAEAGGEGDGGAEGRTGGTERQPVERPIPLAVVLDPADWRDWQAVKKELGVRGDTEAFLAVWRGGSC